MCSVATDPRLGASVLMLSRDVWEGLDVLGGFGGIETSPRRGRILDLLPTRVMMSLCIDNYWIELR